jgi:hypothetical protein
VPLPWVRLIDTTMDFLHRLPLAAFECVLTRINERIFGSHRVLVEQLFQATLCRFPGSIRIDLKLEIRSFKHAALSYSLPQAVRRIRHASSATCV